MALSQLSVADLMKIYEGTLECEFHSMRKAAQHGADQNWKTIACTVARPILCFCWPIL